MLDVVSHITLVTLGRRAAHRVHSPGEGADAARPDRGDGPLRHAGRRASSWCWPDRAACTRRSTRRSSSPSSASSARSPTRPTSNAEIRNDRRRDRVRVAGRRRRSRCWRPWACCGCPTCSRACRPPPRPRRSAWRCLLIGAALQLGDFASFIRVASIGAFVLLTTPVAGHVIARASYFAGVPLWKGTVLDERKRDSLRATRGGLSAQDHNNEDLDRDHMKR